ncbi:MAG: flagellar basal body rod protein FlgB [Oscillospiraceae bacterium]|nr:flagellar basal body rod protein FlgB [Oscillospiraceae bacterium]
MLIGNVFARTSLTERALEATQQRGEVILHNLANGDTPGYKRKDLAFESLLSEAVRKSQGGSFVGNRTDGRHINIGGPVDMGKVRPTVYTDHKSLSYRLDGNNVDMESEKAYEAKNTIRYNALLTFLNNEMLSIRNAISGGRG